MACLHAFAGLVALAAAAQIAPPRIGFLRDGQARLRPVHGVAGNFILGDPVLSGVLAVACSGRFTLVKTAGSVLLLDADAFLLVELPAQRGPARLAFSPEGALVYFTETAELFRLEDGRLRRVEGQLTALTLPLPDGGLVYRSGDELVIRNGRGEHRVAVAAAALEQLGEEWVAVTAPGGRFAVRIRDGEVYRLPETAP